MSSWSAPRAITYAGQEAELMVVRNDGFCWGRIVTEDDTNYDVFVRRDWYDQGDEDALDAFERAAKRKGSDVRRTEVWPQAYSGEAAE